MPRRSSIVAFVAFALASTAPAQVSLPHYEPFDYPPGAGLVAASASWSIYAGAGGVPVVVEAGSLGAPAGMPASIGGSARYASVAGGEDVRIVHASVSANRLYASFVADLTPTVDDAFAIALGGGGAHRGRLFARSDAGGIRFGISKGEARPEAETSFVVPAGEHFLVLAWQHGFPDVLSLFVDPDPSAPEPVPDAVATGGVEASVLTEFRIRQDASGAGGRLDELRLGADWASVTRPVFALNGLFHDGAVLQRNTSVPVWGTALDGTQVTVSFAGQAHQTVAWNGTWRVDLAPLTAGGPFRLTAEGGGHLVDVDDVLVGDVWVCSGQSNMRFDLEDSENGSVAVAGSANPMLRLCEVSGASAEEPLEGASCDWFASAPATSAGFSAVAWYFGDGLQRDLGVPIGLIEAAVGGTSIKTWMTNESLLADPAFAPFLEEKATSTSPNEPTARYNGMIAPLQPFAVRGVIWYQGEADASKWRLYRKLFPAMIEHWRGDWGRGDFPFLFVQLASYGGPGSGLWPNLRESQRLTLSEPGTAMAVTMDVGEENEIHPTRKRPVGQRLALAARAVALGEPLVYSGPRIRTARPLGSFALLRFDHVGSGLPAPGTTLPGFELAGPNRVFFPAEAVVVNDRVLVASAPVSYPAWVRYGWAGFPVPPLTLTNVEGLPASPFEVAVARRRAYLEPESR